ncbi:hypothetical protein BGZ95_007272 [Linnemannia exigua]|uniref:Uncharacterized protein n=1 Tax=Linnemannia exigua TaxID=604196 RepID=A0AAD4H932_9FUNG|nr:hypothetical protein BGZ95_007272 [Linnemannia exigua]
MPSIINTNTHVSSEMDFLSDSAAIASTTTPKNNNDRIQELKDRQRRRRQWLEPEDEFSVPIHTESPLITKSPLDMSSFLLNYRAMHRSVEIMTPPSSLSDSSKNHNCFENSAISSSKGPDCRMNRVLSNSATTSQSGSGALNQDEERTQNRNYNWDTTTSRHTKSRHDGDSTTVASGEHSFLESHIASISKWLTSNAV